MAENREYQSIGAVVQEVDPPKQYQATYAVVDSTAEEEAGGGLSIQIAMHHYKQMAANA